MLVYARILLIFIMISSCFQVIGGVVMLTVSPAIGIFLLIVGPIFAYLAYSNFVEASECANSQPQQFQPQQFQRQPPQQYYQQQRRY